jgi:hypothetical protein
MRFGDKKEMFELNNHTPKTTCLLSSQSHFAHVIKNCKHRKGNKVFVRIQDCLFTLNMILKAMVLPTLKKVQYHSTR